MKRRQVLQALGSAVLGWPWAARLEAAQQTRPCKILFFSRSVLFEHPVVRRQGEELSLGEKTFVNMARQIGCEVECTKDGRVFDRDLDAYAAVVSYTCGRPADLMKPDSPDHTPPVSESGWKKLDAAVRAGKPFFAIHPGAWLLPEAVGADCLGHGSQQVARIQVVSPRFPGAEKLGDSFSLMEEWFSLIRFAKDLHVILVQDCAGMNKDAAADRRCYDRPPFPSTWARMHDKGRVFYTSLGHREDVWSNKIFEQIVLGGLSWALGRLEADITPNIDQVAPQANEFPKA
ncbi:MAG TPA: ThuA domain-containing protein [Candidatus Anammoximicrobium sp.]|nr:ThuA domain-containing protein [Candidatus Anammoximicrobium sp.]